jgi:hypothetical protein
VALLPEQQRALDYARRRGTEAPVESIRSRVAATFTAVEDLVERVPAEVARRQPAPSAWSVQEVVDHLVVSDRPAVQQLADLLAGRPVASPIPAGLQSASDVEWDELRRRFRAVHRDLLAVLATADDETPTAAKAPVEMVVKCVTADGTQRPVRWLERFDWKAFAILIHAHNREHIAQIERTLAAVTAPTTAG